jgi:hypothetical protein
MKSIFKVLSILAAALCMLACTEKTGPGEDPTEDPTEKPTEKPSKTIYITAMSFNIKYPSPDDTNEKAWENRKVMCTPKVGRFNRIKRHS